MVLEPGLKDSPTHEFTHTPKGLMPKTYFLGPAGVAKDARWPESKWVSDLGLLTHPGPHIDYIPGFYKMSHIYAWGLSIPMNFHLRGGRAPNPPTVAYEN